MAGINLQSGPIRPGDPNYENTIQGRLDQQAAGPQAPQQIDVSHGAPAPPATDMSMPAASGPMAGLAGAAPTAAASGGGGGGAMTQPGQPTLDTAAISGPVKLRDGIGNRNPPSMLPALMGLRNYY